MIFHIKYCYDQEQINAATKVELLDALKYDVKS